MHTFATHLTCSLSIGTVLLVLCFLLMDIVYVLNCDYYTCSLNEVRWHTACGLMLGCTCSCLLEVPPKLNGSGKLHRPQHVHALCCFTYRIFLSRNFAEILSLGLGTWRKVPSAFSKLSKFFLRKRASSTGKSLSLSRGGEFSGDPTSASSAENNTMKNLTHLVKTCVTLLFPYPRSFKAHKYVVSLDWCSWADWVYSHLHFLLQALRTVSVAWWVWSLWISWERERVRRRLWNFQLTGSILNAHYDKHSQELT